MAAGAVATAIAASAIAAAANAAAANAAAANAAAAIVPAAIAPAVILIQDGKPQHCSACYSVFDRGVNKYHINLGYVTLASHFVLI